MNVEFGRILHGGDYNPDQWPEHVWDEDIRLMREAKWNIVTLPVFSWVKLQPAEEEFQFEWLDKVLEKLRAAEIDVCMATATASVPKWLAQAYPEVLPVDARGQRQEPGGRHTFCPTSPQFRRLATGLVRRLAARYAEHPALKLWHVGNEYGGNNLGGRCHCELCNAAFRTWLQGRYGTLEDLSQRWDTAFWGHTYTAWDQILSPKEHGERTIQALSLDYDRFQSQSLLDCYRAEAEVLRQHTPGIPITTNMMGPFKPLDYHKWAREVDIVAWDCYPVKDEPFAYTAFAHALMRGLRNGEPWLLLEQTPSQSNWHIPSVLKRPGMMRLWSYQAIAHGSESVMYFQWRRTRGGIEKFHGAVLEHAGTTDTRVFQEVAELGGELEKLGAQTLGGRVQAKVGVLFDWENWWAIEYARGPAPELKYLNQCRLYFAALHEQGIACDVIAPEADLSEYDILIAPMLYLLTDEVAGQLTSFVERGGTLVATFLSGVSDECDSVHAGGPPGPLREMLGLWVEEVDYLGPEACNRVLWSERFGEASRQMPCGTLCERVRLSGAKALAAYGEDFYSGEPAVSSHGYGHGVTYYVATALELADIKPVLREVCRESGVHPLIEHVPAGVEVSRRSSEGGELLYVLNHSAAPVSCALPEGQYRDLLTDGVVSEMLELAGYGVKVLQPDFGPD